MTFLLLVRYCKVGRGQLIGMIRVRIVMIMMMIIGLSSCPVNTRSRREIKQREIFFPIFRLYGYESSRGLVNSSRENSRPVALNDVSFQASYFFFCLFQVNSLFFQRRERKVDPSEIRGERISSRTSTERFFIRRSEYPM